MRIARRNRGEKGEDSKWRCRDHYCLSLLRHDANGRYLQRQGCGQQPTLSSWLMCFELFGENLPYQIACAAGPTINFQVPYF